MAQDINQSPVAGLGLVYEPLEEETIAGYCKIHNNQGWNSVSLKDLLGMNPQLVWELQACKDTVTEWEGKVGLEWFNSIHYYDRYSCILMAMWLLDISDTARATRLRRGLTVSAIVYEFELPEGVWLLDNKTLDSLLRFLVLTEPIKVVMGDVETLRSYLPMYKSLRESVGVLISNSELMRHVFAIDRPPNLVVVRKNLGFGMDLEAFFSENQLRKALTCIYLRAGLPVPRDYLYRDIEVVDYVNCAGEFEVTSNNKK